jgi:putative heme iron utilization protein
MSVRARRARELVRLRRHGVLCTNSVKRPGFPFGSVTPYALDDILRPLFLMSGLAVHSRNLEADPKASLFVLSEGDTDDPLQTARANLFGEITPVCETDLAEVAAAYLTTHPDAGQWAGFGDFRFYRLEVDDIYYVGGFGEMGWVTVSDYRGAS